MVHEINRRGRMIYQCELCLFGYGHLEDAERCEQYCATHQSRSPKIMRKAILKPEPKFMS